MCLEKIYPKSEIKKLPKKITAYKVVRKVLSITTFSPLICCRSFEKENRLKTLSLKLLVGKMSYTPYYHCFVTVKGARKFARYYTNSDNRIIEVQIDRKDVTRVGEQNKVKCIVTKAFTTNFKIIAKRYRKKKE